MRLVQLRRVRPETVKPPVEELPQAPHDHDRAVTELKLAERLRKRVLLPVVVDPTPLSTKTLVTGVPPSPRVRCSRLLATVNLRKSNKGTVPSRGPSAMLAPRYHCGSTRSPGRGSKTRISRFITRWSLKRTGVRRSLSRSIRSSHLLNHACHEKKCGSRFSSRR